MAETLSPFRADPYAYREARRLVDELCLSEPVAITLVRRGYRTPEAARAFLDADESHSPAEFESMGEVVERVLAAVRARRRITVHGDFDVDGVCSTTILVSALRELGADCDWLIPDRIVDGYGLKPGNVQRLADRGTSLIVTVDCGITGAEEVALAHSLGLEVIVTDHHQPGKELPDCPILHPSLDGYPFPDLCGTAVAWKLACALREASGMGSPGTPREREPGDPIPDASPDADLDLVALATVADMVPLVGENRSLVKRGLEEVRRARRPGIRALLEVAGCEPARLDEGGLSFQLAPRINAVGRLYRADAGVELFLTDDQARATEIATELNRANSERRAAEREVEAAAESARRELPDDLREAPGLVLAGEGWHPGVIGIVASRLVERHHRPVVVVSLDGKGGGRGSGRSIPGFDLLAGFEACAGHLVRFGGHRAAAGLELRSESLDAFREGFAAHAAAVLGPEDLKRTERIDAMVGGPGLGIDLAEELERLAPFGMGNPRVRFLVPSAQVRDVRTMGNGKHARFSLHSGSHRALGVAFGRSTLGVGEDDPVDIGVRLEVNRWNGSVEPRVVLRELHPLESGGASLHACSCPDPEWWERFERELRGPLDGCSSQDAAVAEPASRERVRGCGSAASVIAELVSSGAGVLVVGADAARRAALASGATGLARFNGGVARIACARCGGDAVGGLATRSGGGLALTDYAVLEASPSLAADFDHVVLVDPPASARLERLASRPVGNCSDEGVPPGYLHATWDETDIPLTISVLEERFAQRPQLIAMFRDIRDAGGAGEDGLRQALEGTDSHPRSPEAAARCFRVLEELGVVQGSPDGRGGTVGVVSSEETTLERSAAFRAYSARYQEDRRFLERHKQP